MNLPNPPADYSPGWQARQNTAIAQADQANLKRDRDNDVGAGRLILTSPDGTRYALAVADDGTLSTVPA